MGEMADLEGMIRTHPCYNEEAHREYARMHLPVAPNCNIKCNYCNRKYDCSNESRPGVTSEVLSPREAADKVHAVLERIPQLKVIGIAGPGDPLANESTFETLRLMSEEFPELTLCISTNGLNLPDEAQGLYDLGVRFVTVTMNASKPSIGGQIYGSVIWDGRILKGEEAAERLISQQKKGIEACARLGMLVKVNIVMIPGINDGDIPELVKMVKGLGAYIVNILPLIPVEGTEFSDRRAPTPKERMDLMDRCELDARMMRHCRQCRADAIGLLGEDRSSEFSKGASCQSSCGPLSNEPSLISLKGPNEGRVAVATSDGINVEYGFGNAKEFWIYSLHDGIWTHVDTVRFNLDSPVAGESHRDHISRMVRGIQGCKAVVVKEIGPMPTKVLTAHGMGIVIADGRVDLKSLIEHDGRC